MGQLIFSTTTTDKNLKLDTSNWSNGLYSIKIMEGEKMLTRKIIKGE
jgi:hypothetical protein